MTRGRTIRVFLADGIPGGIITAEIINWTGHIMVAPRSSIVELIRRSETGRTGVYFLIGPDPQSSFKSLIYIGETDNIGRRLAQHNKDDSKDFWDRVCVVTSKDGNITKAHARYLEGRLIGIAHTSGRATLQNNTAPEFGLLPEADTSDMEVFIDELRLVMPVLSMDFLRESGATLLKQDRPSSDLPIHDAMISEKQAEVLTTGNKSRSFRERFRPSSEGPDSPQFELRDSKENLVAHAVEVGGEMVVTKGSQARREAGDSLTGTLLQRRQELIGSGILIEDPTNPRLYIFSDYLAFNSPSQASAIILARSDNGRKSWYVEGTRVTYADWQEEQVSIANRIKDWEYVAR